MKELDSEHVRHVLHNRMIQIGDTIRKWRLLHGVSQQKLANSIDADKCLISEIERGHARNITLHTLLKLSYVMGVDLY